MDILLQLCIMFHMYEVTATTTFMRWLNGLRDAKAQTIIAARIERVKVGNFGDCKSVGDGVSELRIAFGPGYRLYYTVEERKIVILLAGGDKSTQQRDIAAAKAMM
ncbi:type II toxin-antitoxin system RelE/ParE family toxin [soil metagenome]